MVTDTRKDNNMNTIAVKNAIREELGSQIRRAITEDVIIEAVYDAIRNMDLRDAIEESVATCVAENVELVIQDMVEEVVDEIVEEEVVNVFENL